MSHAALYWSQIVGIGASGGNATKQLQQVNCGIGKQKPLIQKEGARGSRSHHQGNVTSGPYTVGGPLVVQPSPDELRKILPYIFGTAESGSGSSGSPWVYALAETLPDMVVQQDLRPDGSGSSAQVFKWDGCKVNTARFSASAGSPILQLEMDVQGKTEATGTSFPSIGSTLTVDQPFIFSQLVLTLDGTTRLIDNWSLAIDNALELNRMLNSTTRTDIPEQDRIITLTCDNPFTVADLALYDQAVAGIAASAVFTNGSSILTFTLANVKCPTEAIEKAQRGEAMTKLNFQAFETGTPGSTTKELVVNLSTS